MKRYILFLALLLTWAVSSAQTHPYTLTTMDDCKGSFWAYTDTLTDAESIQNIIRVKSPAVMDMEFQVVFKELSGAATATLYWFGSNDGTTFTPIDTATAATTTSSIWANIDDFNYSYVKLFLDVSGTQTSTMNCFYSFRKE